MPAYSSMMDLKAAISASVTPRQTPAPFQSNTLSFPRCLSFFRAASGRGAAVGRRDRTFHCLEAAERHRVVPGHRSQLVDGVGRAERRAVLAPDAVRMVIPERRAVERQRREAVLGRDERNPAVADRPEAVRARAIVEPRPFAEDSRARPRTMRSAFSSALSAR